MATKGGIEGFYVETHNWGKSVAFWKALGFELKFETNHHSGELRHPEGGPYIFLAERPASKELEFVPVLMVESEKSFQVPKSGQVARAFKKEHWGVMEMQLLDPDRRLLRVHAPIARKKAAKKKVKKVR